MESRNAAAAWQRERWQQDEHCVTVLAIWEIRLEPNTTMMITVCSARCRFGWCEIADGGF